ncbi:MAG TPA: hypothetical protein VIL69_15620, partial [Roseomonas sp.]
MATSSSTIPQPSRAGDLVGLILENPGQTSIAPAPVTFGQNFLAGAVSTDGGLVLRIGGQAIPVQ